MQGGSLPSLLASGVPLTLLVATRQFLGCTKVLYAPLAKFHSLCNCLFGSVTIGLDPTVPPRSLIENASMSVQIKKRSKEKINKLLNCSENKIISE